MKQLSDMTMFELATEMNSLMRDMDSLAIRYNMVVKEIKSRNNKLKDDPNLEPKVLRKELDYEKTN
jgi:hypothetical protein